MMIYYFRINKIILVVTLLLLGACQSTPDNIMTVSPLNSPLYFDNNFPGYQQLKIENQQEIFAINSEMKLFVQEQLLPERSIKKRTVKLIHHIFDKESIDLTYRDSANLTAIQAYSSQQANCLSLTIMAYAIAKEANLLVKFQDVETPEYWTRSGKYNLMAGHVNLVVAQPLEANKYVFMGDRSYTIDFNPFMIRKSFPKKTITLDTVMAMFYNNKGAEKLVNKEYNHAYAYFKKASQLSPDFSPSWANLGILYRIKGQLALAEESYRYAISINNKNFTAMKNLSLLLNARGHYKEANEIIVFLHNKRMSNPYYHALLADEAFYVGNTALAINEYRKAIKLDRSNHEFYFGLAKVYYTANESKKAIKAIKKAIRFNKARKVESQYIAKLDFIESSRITH
jgi:Flp pilus assembly protein TadD